jgi:hypothetical protein
VILRGAIVVALAIVFAAPGAAQKPRDVVTAPQPKPKPKPALAAGSLVVVTDPVGARVLVYRLDRRQRPKLAAKATSGDDGRCTFAPLAPGKYRVVAQSDEHEEFAGEVSVAAGKPQSVAARLRPAFGFAVLTGPDLDDAARITVDGRPVERAARGADGALRIKLAPGTHAVRVERPGNRPFASQVTVVAGEDATAFVALERLRATIVVRSQPGASVFVDGRARGTVPSTGRLAVEEAEPGVADDVRVELDEHEPFATPVTPAAGVETLVEAALAPLPASGPFEETFLGGLALWEAPASWRADASTGVLEVRGEGVGLPSKLRYRDCEVVFNLRLLDARGAAWMVRARDARNGYLFHLSGPGGRSPNQLWVYVVRDGAWDAARPASAPLPVDPPVAPGESYRIRIRVEGEVVQTWVTPGATGVEASVGLFRDLDRTFASGVAGLTTIDGAAFQVEGFVIRPLPSRRQ